MRPTLLWLLVFIVGMTSVFVPANTEAVPLSTLISQNGTLQLQDKVFSNFSYTSSLAEPARIDAASAVDVGVVIVDSHVALILDIDGLAFTTVDFFGDVDTGTASADFRFDVSVVGSSAVIEGVTVNAGLFTGGFGAPSAQLFSRFTTTSGTALAAALNTDVMTSVTTPLAMTTASLRVIGDLDLRANFGSAGVDGVTYVFDQTTRVPEPGALALVVVAGIGLGAARWRWVWRPDRSVPIEGTRLV